MFKFKKTKKVVSATGQEMNKPAFPKMGLRQGDMNKAPISQGVEKSN